ncbi:MAG: hypothetical protein HOJ95_14670 [Nitrospinaceae bacterium]|nr:hypothetical protein [Nitrospinaceae bacterium]
MPRRRKSGQRAAFLSPLAMGDIPRFYSNQEDSEVISLLGDATPTAAVLGDEPTSLAVEESHSVDSELGDDSWLEDEATGTSETVLDIGEDNEEIALDVVLDDADALADEPEAALLEDSLDDIEAVDEVTSVEPTAVDEPELEDFDSLLEEATGDAGAETPDAELEGFDALTEEAELPAEEAPAGNDDVDDILSEALGGEDDLESGLDETVTAESGDTEESVDDMWAETPDAELEGFDALTEEAELSAEEAPADNDDVDDILSEALGGEDDLESGLDETAVAEAGDTEESVDDMWADAFTEEEAGAAAAVPAEEASAGDDDMSNMWDDAFAEQDAAEKADVEQELGDESSEVPDVQDTLEAPADEGELADLDDSDLEKLWDEALEGSGDDEGVLDEISMEQESEGEAVADVGDEEGEFHELSDDDDQDELDDLLSEAGDNVEIEESAEGGDDEIGDDDFDPSGPSDPFDDDGEIEAFIEDGDDEAEEDEGYEEVEEEPVAVGAPAEEEVQEHLEDTDAPFQNRLIAGLVDTVLVGFLVILFAVGTHFIIGQVVDSVYGNPESMAMVMAIDLVILFLLSFFYAVYFIGGWGGTPGLRTAGLVVVDLENRPVGYMQAVLRYFGTLVAVLPAGLGQILTVVDKQGRGLGDRLAGTKVIFRASL